MALIVFVCSGLATGITGWVGGRYVFITQLVLVGAFVVSCAFAAMFIRVRNSK